MTSRSHPPTLHTRSGPESDASVCDLSSFEGMGAEAHSALAPEDHVSLPVGTGKGTGTGTGAGVKEGACMIADDDLVPSPLPVAVCDAIAGGGLGAAGTDAAAHAVPSKMDTDNARVRMEQHRARMHASRSLSTGMIEDNQRGAPDAGAHEAGQREVVYDTYGQPLSHPFNDNESRLSWHLANHHYPGLPHAHRGRASTSMAVGARTGSVGLRLKGMGVSGAGLLGYSSFGIPPGEIRKMSVNHVCVPSPMCVRILSHLPRTRLMMRLGCSRRRWWYQIAS